MSYKQSFSSTVTVRGSVSIRYPASETGGVATADYKETVPVEWTVLVDTEPFDESVQSTEIAMDALTGSVVALNGAQLKSIQRASNRVADSLSGGFFALIGKDLSENKAKQANTIRSKFALLMQYSKDLEEKQNRMDEDVARLKRHYHSVFHSLDEDLSHRISSLDQSAFSLGKKSREELLLGPYLKEAAFCLDKTQEGGRTNNMLLRARTNRSVFSALDALGRYIQKNVGYKEKLSGIFARNSAGAEEAREYVPVIVYDTNDGSAPGDSLRCIPPQMDAAQQVAANVYHHVRAFPDAVWTAMDREQLDLIDQRFCSYVERDSQADQSPDSARIHLEMLRLWNADKNALKEMKVRS